LEGDLNRRIADAVKQLRSSAELSLEQLAELSGVSRSMLSLIERGESSPTAVVLDKVATALGVPLALLFEEVSSGITPVSRRQDRVAWEDPETGYTRWNVTPEGYKAPLQIVEVLFPPGARLTYESGPRARPVHQQIWVLEGQMQIVLGAVTHMLAAGDCLAMELDEPITYRNPTTTSARYAVVVAQIPALQQRR
jgi:transcriptional regulator with XRE-family HTH domain